MIRGPGVRTFWWVAVHAAPNNALAIGPYRKWKWMAWCDYYWFKLLRKPMVCSPGRFS